MAIAFASALSPVALQSLAGFAAVRSVLLAVGRLFGLRGVAEFQRWTTWLAPTPKIILFPVLLMLCGVGPGSKVAMGAVSCSFPVVLGTAAAVRGLDRVLPRVGRSFRARGHQMLVATGSPPTTSTQAMSGQVDVGWASPPFGVEAVQARRTRIVVRGSNVPGFADESVRLMIANAGSVACKSDAIGRHMDAYREALDWMYSDPAALVAHAKWTGVTPELARQVRDEF